MTEVSFEEVSGSLQCSLSRLQMRDRL
ncbi:hypothetical protein ANCDUO_22492 [Ancylostoma duodenale]|uniref:Uncharacterized protein n=1 Tax=Ancylostoma duodenale TaxID=51022 RepID=A0A0C2CC87_9BILA|nr:hypothetical protein ANCDUO_22492 [Ancylostoma duodenale]